jgi:hypothetical protein
LRAHGAGQLTILCANGGTVEFGQKEPFLADMNQYILAKKDDMKRFLDTVSVRGARACSCCSTHIR